MSVVQGAESMAPVRCAERLAGLGLHDRQVVSYCAALLATRCRQIAGGSSLRAECSRSDVVEGARGDAVVRWLDVDRAGRVLREQ